MTEASPLVWKIDVADLPDEGLKVEFTADAAVRERLAAHAGIEAISSLTAKGELRSFGGGVEARLRLEADVVQSCVVTLAPVPAHIDEKFRRRFIADWEHEPPPAAIEIIPGEEDQAEPMVSDMIDLGPVLTEEFVLALNPYPRAEGAKLPEDLVFGPAEASPFAVLKRLKE